MSLVPTKHTSAVITIWTRKDDTVDSHMIVTHKYVESKAHNVHITDKIEHCDYFTLTYSVGGLIIVNTYDSTDRDTERNIPIHNEITFANVQKVEISTYYDS